MHVCECTHSPLLGSMLKTLLTLNNSCQNIVIRECIDFSTEQTSFFMFHLTYLSKVKVEETQSKKLQAHREAIKEPVDWSGQVVCRKGITEIKRKECRAKCCPEQAKKQKNTLVAPSLMSVEQQQPKLNVYD